MRAACCKATVLSHSAPAADIRLLRVLWPDPGHAPTRASSSPCAAGGGGSALPLPAHQRPQVGARDPDRLLPLPDRGQGTARLAALKEGDALQLTGPMGNGFDVPDIAARYEKIALVGGGIGTAPCTSWPGSWRRPAGSRTCFSVSGTSPTAWSSTGAGGAGQGVHRQRPGGVPRLCHPAVRPGGV